MANLVFYDFETCSSNVSYGQIIQAAAVLVNDSFLIIIPFMLIMTCASQVTFLYYDKKQWD